MLASPCMALLRPSDLARLWHVHPKTVLAWIHDGALPAIRTPGAQFRVRSEDAHIHATAHDLSMLPRALQNPGGTVFAIGKSGATVRALARTCKARGAALVTWSSVLDALLAIGAEPPDVLAIDAATTEMNVAATIRAIRRAKATASLPTLVYDLPGRNGVLARLGVQLAPHREDGSEAVRVLNDLLDEIPRGQRRLPRPPPTDRG